MGGFRARLKTHEFIYVAMRFALVVVLTSFVMFDLVTFDSADMNRFVVGMTIIFIVGFAQVLLTLMGARDFRRFMLMGFPLDVLGLTLLTSGLHLLGDPLYPMFVGVAVVHGFEGKRRTALIVGVLTALGYTIGHVGSHALTDVPNTAIHIFNSVSIIALPAGVATVYERHNKRAAEIEAGRVEREGLTGRLQRRLAELQAVSEISEVIHSDLDFERVGPLMLDILQKLLDVPSACLMVIDKGKSETLFSASVGLRGRAAVPAEIATGVLTGSLVPTPDEHLSCLSVVDHHNLMVVFCSDPDGIEALADEDRLVLQAVGSELVVAVENSQLYKLTKRLAITDELTGLHNYRHLQTRLQEEYERAKRYRKDLSLLMIDVDDFKVFNDTHGHIAGDHALEALGGVLREAVREVDIVARYGGEEFSVVLPETDAAGAFVVAEKIREAVSEYPFKDADGKAGVRVTASVGLASYPAHAHDRESLLRQADDALYRAKNTGKNRVRAPESRGPQPVSIPIQKEN